MSRTFKTDYQALSTFDDEANDDELDVPPSHNVVQIRPDQSRGQSPFTLRFLSHICAVSICRVIEVPFFHLSIIC